MALFEYTVEAQSGHARAGLFETAHGTVKTPLFMPVGTQRYGEGHSPSNVEGDRFADCAVEHLPPGNAPRCRSGCRGRWPS